MTALVSSLHAKLDNLTATTATKSDLNTLHTQLTNETRQLVHNATQPLTTNVTALTQQLTTLTTRVITLEQRPPSSSTTPPPTALTEAFKRQQAALNKLDPATRSVVFIGFPTSFTAPQRLTFMKDFLHRHDPHLTYATMDSVYQKDPTTHALTLTKVAYVELYSTTQRDNLLKAFKDTPPILTDGTTLRLDKKKTDTQRTRNWSLHHAHELLTKHHANANATVTINWKLTDTRNRNVTVNNTPAFTQTPHELTGTFTDTYNTLSF